MRSTRLTDGVRSLCNRARTQRRTAQRLLAGVFTAVLVVFPLVTPTAFAGDGGLLIQVGGVSSPFTSNPPPIFSGPPILPGGSMRSDVSAKNASGVGASLSLRAEQVEEKGGSLGARGSYDCSTAGGLADQLAVQVWATTGGSHDELYDGSVCHLEASPTLLTQSLQPGSRADFNVIAALPRTAGNDLMGASTTWTFIWQLTGSAGVVGSVHVSAQSSAGGGGGAGHGGGGLAFTGADLDLLVAVGAAAILAGVCIGFLGVARNGSGRGRLPES